MYRYSQHVRDGMSTSGAQRRFLAGVSLVLLIAVVVLAITAYQATSFRNEFESLAYQRMQYEATQAINQVNTMSRTGGSGTSASLAKIRQHVYSVETLVDIHAGLNGVNARIISEDLFNEITSVLDTFSNKLQTGSVTTEQQASLLTLLTTLSDTLHALTVS